MNFDYQRFGLSRQDFKENGLSAVDIKFSRGLLSVTTHKHHPDWDIGDLLEFAERVNPKRAFLFVSKVLGKHIPVKPSIMAKAYKDLVGEMPALDSNSKTTVVVMAETAVGLGAGVYRELKYKNPELDSVFMCTTRTEIDGAEIMGEFHEEHSHSTRHILYKSPDQSINNHIYDTETLILIDDEATTGKTFVNLYNELKRIGLSKVKKVILVTLVDWSKPEGYSCIETEIETVSLLSGEWHWEDAKDSGLTRTIPTMLNHEYLDGEIIAPNNWGRIPVRDLPKPNFSLDIHRDDGPIHILGACEYLWIPFLIAEELEQKGCDVVFSSTTRSPIAIGGAIGDYMWFGDYHGKQVTKYAYNVNTKSHKVYLMLETNPNSVCKRLAAQNIEIVHYRKDDPIFLCDMDDTLFQTERRRSIEQDSVAASYRVDGRPIGFMTGTQNKFVNWILKNSMVIPVTARDKEALGRISMQFNYGAVCCHGGLVLLPNGEVDQEWLDLQKPIVEACREDLAEIEKLAAKFHEQGAKSWIVREGDNPFYVVVKKSSDSEVSLSDFVQQVKSIYGDKFYFHLNVRNLAIIPAGISKKLAASYVIAKFNHQGNTHPVLGFGDSLSDYGFMNLCDWMGIPRESQLNKVLGAEVNRLYVEKGCHGE